MHKIALVFVLSLCLLLTACTGAAPQATITPASTPAPEGTSAPTAASLDGTRWVLDSMGKNSQETPPVAGSTITLEFASNGQVGGNAGCNTYGGSYETRDNNITFVSLVSTLMACADNAITEQEGAYLQALNSASTFEQTADGLTILYEGGSGRLHFTPAQAP
jgi:heat shock protein HslJ